jgi:hypothetical protein
VPQEHTKKQPSLLAVSVQAQKKQLSQSSPKSEVNFIMADETTYILQEDKGEREKTSVAAAAAAEEDDAAEDGGGGDGKGEEWVRVRGRLLSRMCVLGCAFSVYFHKMRF